MAPMVHPEVLREMYEEKEFADLEQYVWSWCRKRKPGNTRNSVWYSENGIIDAVKNLVRVVETAQDVHGGMEK